MALLLASGRRGLAATDGDSLIGRRRLNESLYDHSFDRLVGAVGLQPRPIDSRPLRRADLWAATFAIASGRTNSRHSTRPDLPEAVHPPAVVSSTANLSARLRGLGFRASQLESSGIATLRDGDHLEMLFDDGDVPCGLRVSRDGTAATLGRDGWNRPLGRAAKSLTVTRRGVRSQEERGDPSCRTLSHWSALTSQCLELLADRGVEQVTCELSADDPFVAELPQRAAAARVCPEVRTLTFPAAPAPAKPAATTTSSFRALHAEAQRLLRTLPAGRLRIEGERYFSRRRRGVGNSDTTSNHSTLEPTTSLEPATTLGLASDAALARGDVFLLTTQPTSKIERQLIAEWGKTATHQQAADRLAACRSRVRTIRVTSAEEVDEEIGWIAHHNERATLVVASDAASFVRKPLPSTLRVIRCDATVGCELPHEFRRAADRLADMFRATEQQPR